VISSRCIEIEICIAQLSEPGELLHRIFQNVCYIIQEQVKDIDQEKGETPPKKKIRKADWC
jgi:hypothetical protein